MLTVELRSPVAVGAKLQLAVQLSPFFRLVGHPQFWGKSAVEDSTTILRIVLPLLFVMVTAWEALVVPTICFAKFRDAAESVRGGATPTPLSAAVCGLLAPVSTTVNTPLRVPVAVGVNVTSMLHVAPARTLRPAVHVLDAATRKSPVVETLEIVIGVVWPLVS